jgi:hypothetical protein
MTVFQSKLFMKKETLLYSSTTTCSNSKGKAQYIKTAVNGWHQLVQLNITISTQSSPHAKKAVTSTHCESAAIRSPDGHNCGSRSGSVSLVIPAINNRTRGDDQQHVSQIERADVCGETVQLTSKFGVGKRLPWRWRQYIPLSYHYIPDDNLNIQN